jgi:hypothetical protein
MEVKYLFYKSANSEHTIKFIDYNTIYVAFAIDSIPSDNFLVNSELYLS